MQLLAARPLKFAYALVILAAAIPIGLANSGWVALATGGAGAAIPFIGPVLFLVLGIYRVVTVFRNPFSLGSYEVEGFARVLRNIGVFALYVGAAIGLLNLLSWPLMSLIGRRTDSGIEFFVVGMYLAFLGGVGIIGIISFELSRLLGLEEHARSLSN